MEFADLILTPTLDGVVMHLPFSKTTEGTLCITGHYMIISSRKEDVEELWLLHESIDAMEKKSFNQGGGSIVVKCKDFRVIQLDIPGTDDLNNVYTTLERLTSLSDPKLKYPFFFRPIFQILEDGWSIFLPDSEYGKLLQTDEWKLSHINADYSICSTYPSVLVVPQFLDDESIIAAAKFREGGRFPVLSYKHDCGAVLLRSSQPLTGPNNKRCRQDERLLNSLLANDKRGFIVDTRSEASSQAAKARGGGYEVEMHYPQWKRVHSSIEKHHKLLESLSKLVEACSDVNCSVDKWLNRLDNSSWLTYVNQTLNCACLVAQFLDLEKASVLVHGGEGLDSTLIVTSLTQIILNPDCRTVRGLEALIEREWLQAGHPFATRNAKSCFSSQNIRNKLSAPTFLLFLDCLYQLQFQFICSFEFTPSLLMLLFEHSYFSEYGTFIGNNDLERQKLNLKIHSTSLWCYINRPEVLKRVLNPIYDPNKNVIWPSVAPMSMELWSGLFLRWVVSQDADIKLWDQISEIKEQEKDLRGQAGRLRRQLVELEREAVEAGLLTDEPTLPVGEVQPQPA